MAENGVPIEGDSLPGGRLDKLIGHLLPKQGVDNLTPSERAFAEGKKDLKLNEARDLAKSMHLGPEDAEKLVKEMTQPKSPSAPVVKP